MRKCNWFTGHCLHKIDGTERKLKRTKKKVCSKEDDYAYECFWGKCVDIVVDAKCCWCDKISKMELRDFDMMRVMSYPDYEDKK